MLIGDLDKQPAEVKRVVIDYSQWLQASETITAVESFFDPDNGLVMVEDPEFDTAAKTVTLLIGGGTDQIDYVVTLRAHTTLQQIKEDELLVRVLELEG